MAMPAELGYQLGEQPVYSDELLERYATADPTVYVEFFDFEAMGAEDGKESFKQYLQSYDELRSRLITKGLEPFIPEIIDADEDDSWIAFGVTAGLYTLEELAKSHTAGLDGRDWAWILRRVLIVLDCAEVEATVTPENLLIHPEAHGIVLLGWRFSSTVSDSCPLEKLTVLMQGSLKNSLDSLSQIQFLKKCARYYEKDHKDGERAVTSKNGEPVGSIFDYKRTLQDYDLKLRSLYGPRKFRELTVDKRLSKPFLKREAKAIAKSKK